MRVQGAKRGSTLTQRMLSFARRQALEPAPLDLGDLVRNMLELLERSIGPSVADRDPPAPCGSRRCMADQNQLEMALVNLLVNARDAMPQGGAIAYRSHAKRPSKRTPHPPGARRLCRACPSATKARAWMHETLARAVSPSSPPRGSARAPALACPWCMAWPSRSAAVSS